MASSTTASLASTRGAAAERAERAEQEALRWAINDPVAVLPTLDAVMFADEVHREALELLVAYGDLRTAADALDEQPGHRTTRASRSELATTTSELPDIARAAISGVTSPAIASGTANRL